MEDAKPVPQEFPKCLYKDGNPEGPYVVVHSAEEEAASDFLPVGGKPHADGKKKRGE